ncbi:MAG TPA: LysE family translocator [Xanthobacteraceae bacterium]|nr:LysE family translocator [Xanthobacteraceae bacterium]
MQLSGIGPPLISLIVASIIVMGSPGPSTMSATAVGAAFGFRRAFPYLAGLILGTTAVLVAVAAGVVSLLLSVPKLAPVLLIASAIYIAYLAFQIATAPPLSSPDRATSAPPLPGGFLLAVANPKAYFAIAAVFAGANFGLGSPLTEGLLKVAVLTIMIVLIHLFWVSVGASFSHLLHDPVSARIINVLFAAILIVTTILAIVHY